MATLALVAFAAVAPSTFAGVGGALLFAGLSVGAAYIDNAYIVPALTGGPPDVKGPRLGDLTLQTGSEGSNANFAMGRTAPMSGTVIWIGPIIEQIDENQVGGGSGGGGGTVTNYHYFANFAVALGIFGKSINKVLKIWADGRLLYQNNTDQGVGGILEFTSTQFSASRDTTFKFFPVPFPGQLVPDKVYTKITSPNGGPDLTGYKTGTPVTVTGFPEGPISLTSTQLGVQVLGNPQHQVKIYSAPGGVDVTAFRPAGNNITVTNFGNSNNNGSFPVVSDGWEVDPVSGLMRSWIIIVNIVGVTEAAGANATLVQTIGAGAANNGTFMCDKKQTNADGSTSIFLINENAIVQAAGSTVTLWQQAPAFDTDLVTAIRIHHGSETQQPDSLISSIRGVDYTPGYRGTCYVVLEHLALYRYGNRIPQLRFLVEVDENFNLKLGIERLLSRAGLQGTQYLVSDSIANIDLRAYVSSGPQPTNRLLEPLLAYGDIIEQEDAGKLKFLLRSEAATVVVPAEDLAAHEGDSESPPALLVTDTAGFDLPQEVNVTYTDPKNTYQQGSQRERRINQVTDNVVTLDMSTIIMSAKTARAIARRMLWMAWNDRFSGGVSLPPSYLGVLEGDIVQVTNKSTNEQFRVRTSELARGNNFVMQPKGVVEPDGTFDLDDAEEEDPTGIDDPDIYVPPVLDLMLMHTAPLRDSDVLTPGFYMALCATDISATFHGGSVYKSADNLDYTLLDQVPVEAGIGVTLTALVAANPRFWDNVNTFDVQMYQGTLSSKTELEVLNGANRMLVGGEILGFQTATLIGTNQYRLSGLLRGQRNTENWRIGHGIGEGVCMLSNGTSLFETIAGAELGTTKYFKAVPSGGTITNYGSQISVLAGKTCWPFYPCHIVGTRDGSNNLTIAWVRRTRALIRLFGTGGAPLLDDVERYEIDILLPGTSTIVRTMIVFDATEAVYSAADQIDDGLTPGSPVNINICMVNNIVGRGERLAFSI